MAAELRSISEQEYREALAKLEDRLDYGTQSRTGAGSCSGWWKSSRRTKARQPACLANSPTLGITKLTANSQG